MEEVTNADIYRWCKEKGVEPLCSFGLVGKLSSASDDAVIRAVVQLYGISQPCTVDRWKGQEGETFAILLSNRFPLDNTLLPRMVVVEDVPGRKVQLVWPESMEEAATPGEEIGNDTTAAGDCFHINSGEDRTEDREESPGKGVETMMDKMVNQMERLHYEGGYRRLRIFSGISPVPAGEETYDTWREAAIQHSEEWQCPEHIKRQRIVESLRGPAMRVIQATRRSKSTATLKDYLEALDFSYGTMEDVGDLMSRLHRTYQEPGETLTQYIYRVDRLIYQIVEKGGIVKEAVDEQRMRQVLKGALTLNPVAQRLRCTRRSGPAPSLTELVKEVKLEEVQIENRDKTIKRVKAIIPAIPAPTSTVMDDRLIKLLEDQNKKIDQLIALQSTASSRPYWSSDSNRGRTRGSGSRGTILCYSCGQPGHRSFECPMSGMERNGRMPFYHRSRDEQMENPNGSSVNPSQAPQQ
ncbi:paraneoplastic antigen Ma3 homolog [Pseudophryne corroboree]|uniref:paraneoplastic antigen Ma3 homolog n=1 Tax=Pseudophryne corroboree TaxID=495146 RepID=UPI0030817CBC